MLALITHSFLYFIIRAVNGLIAIATLATFTRLLSPAEYGVYAIGMSITSVASAILFQWLNLAVVRFLPMYLDDPSKVMDVVARGFWAATAVGALISLGMLPFQQVFSVAPALFGILFLITVALGYHTLALQVATAQSAPVRYGMLLWVKSGVALVAGLIFIHFGGGEKGALLGFLAGLLFAAIVIPQKPAMRMKLGSVETVLSVDMFRYCLPITLNTLAIVIVDVADRLIIGSMLGVDYVAPYAVGYDLVQQLIGPVMNVIFLASYPLILQTFEGRGDEPTRILLHALGSRIVALGLPVAVGVGVLATDIAEVIFGIHYRQDASMIMPWLAAAIFVAGFKGYFLDVVFQLRHATKYLWYSAVLMAVVNVALNLLLLPRYGVIAAAWATLLVFLAGALASWVFGKSVFLLPALGNVFLKSAAASAVMAFVLYLLPSSSTTVWLFAKITFGIAIYASIAWALDVAGCRRLLKV